MCKTHKNIKSMKFLSQKNEGGSHKDGRMRKSGREQSHVCHVTRPSRNLITPQWNMVCLYLYTVSQNPLFLLNANKNGDMMWPDVTFCKDALPPIFFPEHIIISSYMTCLACFLFFLFDQLLVVVPLDHSEWLHYYRFVTDRHVMFYTFIVMVNVVEHPWSSLAPVLTHVIAALHIWYVCRLQLFSLFNLTEESWRQGTKENSDRKWKGKKERMR